MDIPQEEQMAVRIAIQGVHDCLHVCGLMTPAVQDAVNVDVKLPDKFTPDKWVQWEIEFTNYLGTKRG
jgi:hypothetical protein